MKIASSLIASEGTQGLQAKYEEIYAKSDVWLYKKSHGVHSVIWNAISGDIGGKRVLDAGCGAGRLALMCATTAQEVDGIDFSQAAIEIATLNARACRIGNCRFMAADLDGLRPDRSYDVITLVGVLEHVQDPVLSLRRLGELLPLGGQLVVSCPNFLNFRGGTYMTLLTLLGLPMSLADLRQVSYLDMEVWCKASGFELTGCHGAIYRFAWDQLAIQDMVKRVPLAAKDKELPFTLNFGRYEAWLQSQIDMNRKYLEFLENQGLLERIKRGVTLNPCEVEGVPASLWQKMRQYLSEDIDTDPFFCRTPPFCYQGGEAIYFLRKCGTRQ